MLCDEIYGPVLKLLFHKSENDTFWFVIETGQLPNFPPNVTDFYSIMSEGSGSDSDADNESRYGVDAETDEEDGIFFDTNDFIPSDSLRSASYRSREIAGNACSSLTYDKESLFPDISREVGMEIEAIEYPYIRRRDSLPEPKEKEKPVGLWSIIKDNIGKDLSGVCLPVYFNEPLSSLQKCFEDLEYSYLVDRALQWGKQVCSLYCRSTGFCSNVLLALLNTSVNL